MKAEKPGKTKTAAAPKVEPTTAIVRALGQTSAAPEADPSCAVPAQLPDSLRDFLMAPVAEHQPAEVLTEEGAWQLAEMGQQLEARGTVLRGYALSHLRSTLPPMRFSAGLAERNIARRTAYDAIDAFDLYRRFGGLGVVPALAQLGVTKALALKNWQDEQIKEFAAGQPVKGLTLDQAAEMSTRELAEHQRQWQQDHDLDLKKRDAEIAQLRNQVDTLTNENTRLVRNGAGLQAEEDLPHFARTIRQEAMAITEQMSFGIDSLQATLDEHLYSRNQLPADQFRFKPITAGTAYYAIAGIFGRLHQMLQQLETAYPDEMGRLSLDHQLSPVECKRFLESREQLLASAKQAAKARENDRENTKPGKRGAKRK